MKKTVYLSGLPRSGSTIMANILAHHPDIKSTPSDPLCSLIQNMRHTWSNDTFLKSQLDDNFEEVSDRLKRTTQATIREWSYAEEDIVVNKNRGWLGCIEWLREIDPDFKMIVTLRDLRNIYASIEKQHRKTLMLNFPDNMEHNVVDARASSLFADNGLVGSCLKLINNIGDVPDISSHLFICRYEDFVSNPQETTNKVFEFIGANRIIIDLDNIEQKTKESDSYYNMKYRHLINKTIKNPDGFEDVKISPRIINTILTKFDWYYNAYYPELKNGSSSLLDLNTKIDTRQEDNSMIAELEAAIKYATE